MTYFKIPAVALSLALLAAVILPHSASALPTGGVGGTGGPGGPGGGFGPIVTATVPDDANPTGNGTVVPLIITATVARNYVITNKGPDNSIYILKFNAATGAVTALHVLFTGGQVIVGVAPGESVVAFDDDGTGQWQDAFGAKVTIQAHP